MAKIECHGNGRLWPFAKISWLGGGHWPRKRYGDVRPWRPLFTSPVVHKGPIMILSNSQFTSPPFEKKWEIFLNFCPNFSSQAPQIWKFSVHKPPLSEPMISSQVPTSEIQAAHPYLKKKLSVPPSPGFFHPVRKKLPFNPKQTSKVRESIERANLISFQVMAAQICQIHLTFNP